MVQQCNCKKDSEHLLKRRLLLLLLLQGRLQATHPLRRHARLRLPMLCAARLARPLEEDIISLFGLCQQ
jgi:hypothetical protein